MAKRRTTAAILAAATLSVGPVLVSEALAFPYHWQVSGASVWSERPVPPALADHDARRRVEALLAANGGSVDRLLREIRR